MRIEHLIIEEGVCSMDKKEIDYVKDTYMIRGMVVGGAVGCVGLAVLCLTDRIEWFGISVAVGLFGGMLIGMSIKK